MAGGAGVMTTIPVAGIGNVFLGDDGFGVQVVQRLQARREDAWPPGVRVIDYGIRGIDLYYALLDGVDLAILVDASRRDGPPGTLYVIEPSTMHAGSGFESDASPVLISPHDLDPAKVLQAVGAMGGKVGRIVLVACEPESLGTEEGQEGRMGLSSSVAAAVEEAVEVIEAMMGRMSGRRREGSADEQAQTIMADAAHGSQDHGRA